jgi:aldehyde dehydrogenase (NAD+)
MAAWKLGPALACGNTVVMKPAEQTPLSILYLAELIVKAGFPPGVVNIINGDGAAAGQAIASHLGIDKIAFTGSTATGRQVMKLASVNMKNITLETGGKSPLIVFDDAELDQAVKWAHIGIMSNMGQICTATSRVLVQEGVYDKFVELFKAQVAEVSKVGDPFAEETFQVPVQSHTQHSSSTMFIPPLTLFSHRAPKSRKPNTSESSATSKAANPKGPPWPPAGSPTRTFPGAKGSSSRRPSSQA